MIDHAAARRLAATAVDAPLSAVDLDALDTHLAGCPSCRRVADALRSDAAALARLDLGPVPVTVRADVAIAAEHRAGRRGAHVGRWVGLVAMGALLTALLGGGAFGGGGASTPTTPPADAVSWHTDVVDLRAAGFAIQAGGKTFTARGPGVSVHSDPGDATYRTLELTWQEHGVSMRMNLYFGGDAASWWVDEIRTYNGAANGDWLTAKGTFFRTPIGATWTGDLDVPLADTAHVGGTPASIHFGGLVLATHPFDGVNEPPGSTTVVLHDGDRPFSPGGPLHCSGILQKTPAAAESELLGLGYSLSWRLDTTTGPNTGYAEPYKRAPAGVIIDEPIGGGNGELIIFVAPFGDPRANPVPRPSDCPPHKFPSLPPSIP